MNTERIGAPLLRREDERLLRGRGQFVSDIAHHGGLHAAFVRSPHAHARLRAIDVSAALAAPGVAAVFTGRDMEAAGVGAMKSLWPVQGVGGKMVIEPPRWALARDAVRHVGEPLALVLAETREAALDAAELVDVDYEPLPAVVSATEALRPGAPQVHAEAPGNVALRFARGDEGKTKEAFGRAAHVVALDVVIPRIAGCAIEPRAVLARPESRGATLFVATQVPHHVRRLVSEQLGLPENALRVIAPDVGGGFGYKGKHYPEETAIAWAALRLDRAVKWVASRSESFVSDLQARDHATHAELALDAEGRFLGLRVATVANLGAWVSTVGAAIPSVIYSGMFAGPYLTPAIFIDITLAFTTTLPTDAYRGAGRPEACFVLEQLIDAAALKLGLDRAEIRRRNLIPLAAMPYQTPIGPSYDSGDFRTVFERALTLADYTGFAARRAASAERGLLRGIGLSMFIESSGPAPSKLVGASGGRAGFWESAEIRVDAGGAITALLGTHNHGQGHATSFAQILASRFGVPVESVEIVEGDTGRVPYGTGTFGSRSITVGGSALWRAADKVVAKARIIAAHLLEAAEQDVSFVVDAGAAGEFRVAGTDRRLSFAEVARAATYAHNLPPGCEPALHESAFYDPVAFAFANGAHVCEVEIDPDTGVIRLASYCAVDDVGVVINPVIVEGQVHGSLAQGIGQVLKEICNYDAETGQLFSASFLDYGMPRADELPGFVTETEESQPCTRNPVGAKGAGESGTIGAPPAVMGAVQDALRGRAAAPIGMPLMPDKLWRALQGR